MVIEERIETDPEISLKKSKARKIKGIL